MTYTVASIALVTAAMCSAFIAPPTSPAPTPPAAGVNNQLTAAEKAAGWVLLFDGTNPGASFRGYKKQEVPAPWVVEDACLVLRGSGGDLITKGEWDNFEFQTDWNVAEGGNSGLMWHVTEDGTYPWETGPEMQILDDAKHADGKSRLTSAGSCYALYAAPEGVVKPAGQWNTARIQCVGTTVKLFLNGQQVVSFDTRSDEYKERLKKSKFASMPLFGTKTKGHVALQDHGDVVKFRNIKVRLLDSQGKPAQGKPAQAKS
jgi:hypothetical protein